jgi:hypothetical protein
MTSPQDKASFSEKLDEVLYSLTDCSAWDLIGITQEQINDLSDQLSSDRSEAKQSIIALVEDWVIGEDIPEHWLTRGQSKQRKIGANNAKAAMRKRLHEGSRDE